MGAENKFANAGYVECEKAKEMKETLDAIKKEFLRASDADGKIQFYCRASALFDASNLIQPYEDFDYRLCGDRKCKTNNCFNKLKKDWEVFIDEVGKGRFNHESPVSEVSAALINEEKTNKRKAMVEATINEAIFKLNIKESIERDIAIIGRILSLINKNADFEDEAFVVKFKNRISDVYGITPNDYDLAKVYDKLLAYYKR